jgi:hypothetical protein
VNLQHSNFLGRDRLRRLEGLSGEDHFNHLRFQENFGASTAPLCVTDAITDGGE